LLKRINKDCVNRIIDANINRTKEGLRVCEEITRFILNNRSLTKGLKDIRHKLDSAAKNLASRDVLLKERFSLSDIGRNICGLELKRDNLEDIFFANIQRAKESTRVLEEFAKLFNKTSALKFKEARYKLYDIEKKASGKVPSIFIKHT